MSRHAEAQAHKVHLLKGLAFVTGQTLTREFSARLAIIRAYWDRPEYAVEYDTQEAMIMAQIAIRDTRHNTPGCRK